MPQAKLRIAIIGLGDIAEKAYLPIITANHSVTPVLVTRDEQKLKKLADLYRVSETYANIDDLIASHPDAAMVHTATVGHAPTLRPLLEAGVHCFVDKPICDNYAEARELADVAARTNAALYTGFNRRHAPLISDVKICSNPQYVHWQKHRTDLPGKPRSFIFDDFIHVIDGLLFFADGQPEDLAIHHRMEGNLLASVHISFTVEGALFSGHMNRMSGMTEEQIEIFKDDEKVTITELHRGLRHHAGQREDLGFDNWTPTLEKRGFVSMIDDFIDTVRNGYHRPDETAQDLRSHKLCEEILKRISEHKNQTD